MEEMLLVLLHQALLDIFQEPNPRDQGINS